METQATSKPNFTSLLDNDQLARVERLRLNPNRRFTNRSQGEHLAGKGGSSTEFSDYREYVPGDDVRYVDWNIFSRLRRPYLKLFQFEEEMHIAILIDASSSMMFDEKLRRAQQLAAAFSVMGLLSMEKVSIYVCRSSDERPAMQPPCTGRSSLKRVLSFLEQIEGGGDFTVDAAIEAVMRIHRGRGIAIVISDFLTSGDFHRPLNMLFSAGLEVFALQVLGQSDVTPDVAGDIRLVDSETGGTLDVSSIADLLGIYEDQRVALEERLAAACRRRNGRFLATNSADSLDGVLFDLLRRQGWVR